jgi:hypothetical protein
MRPDGSLLDNFRCGRDLLDGSDEFAEFFGSQVIEGKAAVFELGLYFMNEFLDVFVALFGAHENVVFFAGGDADVTVCGIETNAEQPYDSLPFPLGHFLGKPA